MLNRPLRITPVPSKPIVASPFPALVLLLAGLLALGFVVLIAAVLLGVGVGDSFSSLNLFAKYEAVWPGQWITSVSAYAGDTPEGHMDCISEAPPPEAYVHLIIRVISAASDHSDSTIVCSDSPRDSLFRQITVLIDQDHVEELDLYSDELQAGVLFRYWGMSDNFPGAETNNNQQLRLYWRRSSYVAYALINRADSVVKFISLTAIE